MGNKPLPSFQNWKSINEYEFLIMGFAFVFWVIVMQYMAKYLRNLPP